MIGPSPCGRLFRVPVLLVIDQTGERGTSRFSRMEIPRMPWFFDPRGPSPTRDGAGGGVAFRTFDNVGTPICHSGNIIPKAA